MRILLIGCPGAGKGAVGKILAGEFAAPHISIGDRVRELALGHCSLGVRIRRAFELASAWAPLDDALTVEVAELSTVSHDSWILDGFPRNVRQAEMAPWLQNLDVAVILHVTDAIAMRRILLRSRTGDSEEKFARRMAAERERLPPLIEMLRSRIPLVEVDADQELEIVLASVHAGLANARRES